jgi:hypothetical protein
MPTWKSIEFIDFNDGINDGEVLVMASMGEIEPENVHSLLGEGLKVAHIQSRQGQQWLLFLCFDGLPFIKW